MKIPKNIELLVDDSVWEVGSDYKNQEAWDKVSELLKRAENVRADVVLKKKDIDEVWDRQFSTKPPSAKQGEILSGTVFFESLWRLVSTMKMPDFSINIAGVGATEEEIVTKATRVSMRYSGFLEAYQRLMIQKIMYGDSFLETYVREGDGFPTGVRTISLDEIFVDTFAKRLNTRLVDDEAEWVAFIDTYSKEKFKRVFNTEVLSGKIPISYDTKLSDYNQRQITENEGEEIEVLRFIHKGLGLDLVFAGANATLIKVNKFTSKNQKGENSIPVHQFVCFENLKGLYNNGIGDLLYKMNKIVELIFENALKHAIRIGNPLWVANLDPNQIEEFNMGVEKALMQQFRGRLGIVEFPTKSTIGGGTEKIELRELVRDSGNALSTFQFIYAELERRLQKIGIDTNSLEQTNATATEIARNERSQNAFITYTLRNDIYELERIIERHILDLRDNVSLDDRTLIPIRIKPVVRDGKVIEVSSPMLGGIPRILKGRAFSIEIHQETGAYPDISEQKRDEEESLIALAQNAPGSNAHIEALKKYSRRRGIVLEDEDIKPQQQEQVQKI